MQKLSSGLKNKIGFTLTVLAVVLYLVVGVKYLWDMDHKTVKYNCDLAEISPDFPIKVREDCRKLRSGRI